MMIRITPAAVLIPGVQRRFFLMVMNVYSTARTCVIFFLNKQRLSGRLINIMALQRRMPAVYSVTICQECVHTTLQRFFSVQERRTMYRRFPPVLPRSPVSCHSE